MTAAVVAVLLGIVYLHVASGLLLLALIALRAARGAPTDVPALLQDRRAVAAGRLFAFTIWPYRAVLLASIVGAVINEDTPRAVLYTIGLAIHLWAFRGPGGRWKRLTRRVTARVRDAGGRLVITPTPAPA